MPYIQIFSLPTFPSHFSDPWREHGFMGVENLEEPDTVLGGYLSAKSGQ